MNRASSTGVAGSGTDASKDATTSVRTRGSDNSFDSVTQKAVPEAHRKAADRATSAEGSGAAPWKREIGNQDTRKDHGGALQNIPDCDQGRLDIVGGVCKRDAPGGDGRARASAGAKLYRCIRLDGNPLAPPAESTGKNAGATGKALPAESDGNAKDKAAQRATSEDAKAGLHQHVCLSPHQSSIACGEREVLCEISSAPVSTAPVALMCEREVRGRVV